MAILDSVKKVDRKDVMLGAAIAQNMKLQSDMNQLKKQVDDANNPFSIKNMMAADEQRRQAQIADERAHVTHLRQMYCEIKSVVMKLLTKSKWTSWEYRQYYSLYSEVDDQYQDIKNFQSGYDFDETESYHQVRDWMQDCTKHMLAQDDNPLKKLYKFFEYFKHDSAGRRVVSVKEYTPSSYIYQSLPEKQEFTYVINGGSHYFWGAAICGIIGGLISDHPVGGSMIFAVFGLILVYLYHRVILSSANNEADNEYKEKMKRYYESAISTVVKYNNAVDHMNSSIDKFNELKPGILSVIGELKDNMLKRDDIKELYFNIQTPWSSQTVFDFLNHDLPPWLTQPVQHFEHADLQQILSRNLKNDEKVNEMFNQFRQYKFI